MARITSDTELIAERERMALTDTLTGIANRRAAESALAKELARAVRAQSPLSIALFDIDHFKRINDGFGHATGDEVLRIVARVLGAEARLTDTVARWGGEEFIAVLPVEREGALAFAERTRVAIAGERYPGVGQVTASVGVAQLQPGETVHATVARADAHLYEAKSAGRNVVRG